MKKKLFKLYILLFVPLFFFSSFLKGGEHVDLQMEAHIESLKAFKTQAQQLLQEWSQTEEKADFVKRYTFFLERFFPQVCSLAEKVCTKLNLDEPYSKMTRNDINQLLKRKQIRYTTKDGSCTPCTKIPPLDDKIWAHRFWEAISGRECCGERYTVNYQSFCFDNTSIFTLGIYPLLMGIVAGQVYIAQGVSFVVTLPCRPRCSCPETQTKEEYNGSLPIILETTISRIDGILCLIESARKQNESLPEAKVVASQTTEDTK